ncbi:MAG: CcmD family protein [Dehalococcoidia bacterium]|nr:CcmD family protein [Dehalococcoidia bacterium]
MEKNFGYLFAAYLAILVIIFVYVFRIFRAQRKVQADIEALKRQDERKKI